MRTCLSVITGIALTATLVTGCTTAPRQDTAAPQDESTATPTPEPTTAETPSAPAGPAIGTILTVRPEPDELGALGWFQLDDGTFMVIDPTQPLPQVAVDQVIASIPADLPLSVDNNGRNIDAQHAGIDAAGRLQRGTGKRGIVMYSIVGADTPDGPLERGYMLTGELQAHGHYDSKDAALADVQAFIASQPDPELWVFVDSVH